MKRGQAALEFLLTYGWAILAVLAVFLALSYFGVIDVGKFATKSCLSSGGLACYGKSQVIGDSVVISVTNLLGYAITLQNSSTILPLTCSQVYFCSFGDTACTDVTRNIASGQDATIRLNCSISSSTNYKGTFLFDFINPNSGLSERVTVSVSTRR